jgi:MoaA/NifB/PqqE/SkfB family radical SAM enzyme
MMTQLLKTAALKVDYIEDQRALDAHGALSLLVQPIVKKINQRLAEEKPARVRDNDIIASTWIPPIPSGPFGRLILNEARIAVGRFVPQTVSIEATRECGCNCDHCLIANDEEELDKSDIIRIIDEALELGACMITFTEGDPLLRDDIFELIRYVDPDKAVVNLFTPGIEMTMEKALMLKEAGLHNLLIGICSTDPAVHDKIRGLDGAHAKAVKAIETSLKAGLTVTMSTHIKGDQISQISELYDFASELGVHELSLWEGIPKAPDERLTQIDREKIIRMYKSINSTPEGPRLFANTYFEGEMLGCLAGRRWLHVGVDGNVRPCPYLGDSFGNVLDSSLQDIWKNIRRSKKFDDFKSTCPAMNLF